MTTTPTPTEQANSAATHPQSDGNFHYVRYPENGHTWICAFVDWGGGHLDREPKCICPESEDNFFFIEDETEIVEGLYQVLKRRRNQLPPADNPKP